ncbi:MAG: GAF domain-containing protein [Anaerolineales bacterium]|nr:GAF domain-containing protein [Anaerolineales bacterium]
MTGKSSTVSKAFKDGQEKRTTDKDRKIRNPRPLSSTSGNDDSFPGLRAVDRVHELAWEGQHDQAIELATLALARGDQSTDREMALLDLRVDSYIAQGEFENAAQDAAAMTRLAETGTDAFKVQALNCNALVQLRNGDIQDALRTATQAIKIAESFQPAHPLLYARSLYHLSEIHKNVSEYELAIQTAQKAIELFLAEGDYSGAGRACYIMAPSYNVIGNAKESRRAAQRALELCQQAGDQYGIGCAFNALSATDPDIVERIRHYQFAIHAFETAGYRERQSISIGNLGFTYAALGLYMHARRFTTQALQMDREMGNKVGLAYWIENLFDVELRLGNIESARVLLRELSELVPQFGDPRMNASLKTNYAILALEEGNPEEAIRFCKQAVEATKQAGLGNENVHLTYLGQAHLQHGDPASALEATTRATDLHREQGYKLPDSFSSQEIWWRHTQALFASHKADGARLALEQAHAFLLEAIASVRDEGLRRNYLNKVASNCELLKFWMQDGQKFNRPHEQLFAHLAVETNVREPFKRLTDTGLRLNALHTVADIQHFIVEEATELSGGERVLFILEKDGKLEATDSFLPRGEDAQSLLDSIALYLAQARLTRTVQLVAGQEAGAKAQTFDPQLPSPVTRIIAPLISQNQIIGYLYADMDTLYGSFTEVDRDMLGMLANQAAVALDNVNWAQGLEQKVRERTAELHARVEELAIINSVQAGLASQLDVNAIYELIGEQLRSLFDSQAISIVSFDIEQDKRHYEYFLEQGQRINIPDAPIPPLSRYIIQNRQPLLINENFKARLSEIGLESRTLPGTKPTQSMLRMPILVDDQVRGVIGLDNIDHENAFSDTDVRLLTTLASSMSVALEKARLYQQAQEARTAADAASAAKSAFLANMSHELRTPLNAIIGFTRIVRRKSEDVLPEKQLENLDKVLTSGEHLLGLINSVLDIAKIEAGRMEVHAGNFNLNALMEQCANIAIPLLKPSVQFEKRTRDEPVMVNSDQEKIKQIVLNLLSNAAKFTHEGKIILEAEGIEAKGNRPELLRILVTDSGIGISDEAMGRIFGEFQQADSSTTREYGGTGLGLTISRNLARLLGGELTASSKPGKGSVFTLVLPMKYQTKNK